MSTPAAFSLLSRLTARRRRPLREPEPADLGTAFGMEQWLEASPPAPAAVTATSTAPAARPVSRSWRSRLLPGQGSR